MFGDNELGQAREKAQWLRALAALVEDLGFVSSIYIVAHDHL